MKKLAVCEGFFVLTAAMIAADVKAQDLPVGDASRGRAYFQISCAVCHSSELGTNNTVISKQGPSLVGVVGRKAASSPHFNYTQALTDFGLNWDATTLNKFLVNPLTAVPGTLMPMPVPNATNRADVIAYLSTLKIPEGVTLNYQVVESVGGGTDLNDWQRQAPGSYRRRRHGRMAGGQTAAAAVVAGLVLASAAV